MNRRVFLAALPVSCAFVACAASTHTAQTGLTYSESIATSPAGAKGTILVCMPQTTQTREVLTGLNDELGKQYRLVIVHCEGSHAAPVIAEGIRRHQPAGLVLMNNPTVAAYRQVQEQAPSKDFPPAVIVMTSFLDGQPEHVTAATGISYEVPLITVVTTLRKLIATPIERVGVVLRATQAGFVRRQTALARREQISVVGEEISTNPNSSELRRALRLLKQRADVLWILNDDRVLTSSLIAEGWVPGLNERPWLPTIVGAASLVSPQESFGTFAVLPDHTALGVQAAGLLFDLADNDWRVPSDAQVQLPLSTTTSVDIAQARERFALRADALSQVDRILE